MRYRVLVVEDSYPVRRVLLRMLAGLNLHDFEVLEAEDALEAQEILDETSVDLMLLDWRMPKISGIDFLRKIRSSSRTKDLPVVMVTAETALGSIEEALEVVGADGYVRKPFTIEDLGRQVNPLVDTIRHRASQRGWLRILRTGT